jgi:hypothetical protein
MKSRFGFLCLSAFGVCFFAACGDHSAPAPTATTNQSTPTTLVPLTGPAIIASPNPVPAGSGSSGTTVVAWNAGEAVGEVRLSTDGVNEKVFVQGTKGSQEAPWIASGTNYDFRLYGADDKTKVLAHVTVTRNP